MSQQCIYWTRTFAFQTSLKGVFFLKAETVCLNFDKVEHDFFWQCRWCEKYSLILKILRKKLKYISHKNRK